MLSRPQDRNLFDAASSLLELIYHSVVRDIRMTSGNATFGLFVVLIQNAAVILGFYVIYSILGGLRAVAIRGDFMVYLVTGIFFLMTHNRTLGAVMSSGYTTHAVMQHAPMTPIVSVAAAAISVLYQQVMTGLIIYAVVHVWQGSFPLYHPTGMVLPFLLCWLSGIAVGLIFKGMMPFLPRLTKALARAYRATNMFTSGKLFPANYMSLQLFGWFSWNPLLHCIDQARGAAFVNYEPHRSNMSYPFWFILVLMLLGLMVDFWLRRNMSVSWGKR